MWSSLKRLVLFSIWPSQLPSPWDQGTLAAIFSLATRNQSNGPSHPGFKQAELFPSYNLSTAWQIAWGSGETQGDLDSPIFLTWILPYWGYWAVSQASSPLLPGHNQEWLTGSTCRHSQESCVHIASHPLAFWTPPHLDAKVAMSPTCAGCWMSLLQSVAHMCLPSGTFCSQNAKGGIIFQSHSSCWRLESRCGAEGSCPAWSREGVTMTLQSSVSRLAVLRNLEIMLTRNYGRASQVGLVVKNLPANAREVRDAGSIPGSGRSPGGGHGNPLQHSCLENPMEREAWQATVHRVTQSQIRLKRLSTQACIIMSIYWKLRIGYILFGIVYPP